MRPLSEDGYVLASLYHPHHPFNQSPRMSRPSNMSNNPYARHMTPTPPPSYTSSPSLDSVPSMRYSSSPEDHPVEPRSRRASAVPRRRHSARLPPYPGASQGMKPDIIDELDNVTAFAYHHEGPYDAVLPQRNRIGGQSPLEAVRESNAEALRATPREKIIDCLNSHRPLDGTAFYPPGTTDETGHTYDYEEGSNMMDDWSNFFRLPGMKFTDADFKKDPFYNTPFYSPWTYLRQKWRRRKRRSTV